MTTLQFTVPVPGTEPALVMLPQPLTLDALDCVEQAIDHNLGLLRRELGGDARAAGAIECASWQRHLRSALPAHA